MMRITLALPVLLVVGCTSSDPYRRTDVWYPTGANAGNIAAMVAKPRDLILGHGGDRADTRQAAGAVDRVWQDRKKPLLNAAGAAPLTGGASGPGGEN
jgi:hypothetical protein